MGVVNFISSMLDDYYRYKLEKKRCANCDSMVELLKEAGRERDLLINKINTPPSNVSWSVTNTPEEIKEEEMKPVPYTSIRSQRNMATAASFRRVQELQEEFNKAGVK